MLVLRSWYSNVGIPMLVLRCWYSKVGAQMLVLKWWCSNVGTQMLVLKCWYSNVGIPMLVLRCRYSNVGAQMLVLKWWYSHVGTQMLVLKCWYSAVGILLPSLIPTSANLASPSKPSCVRLRLPHPSSCISWDWEASGPRHWSAGSSINMQCFELNIPSSRTFSKWKTPGFGCKKSCP